jgi:hypothetical protein
MELCEYVTVGELLVGHLYNTDLGIKLFDSVFCLKPYYRLIGEQLQMHLLSKCNSYCLLLVVGGLGSVVGLATGCGLNGLGIESWWGEIFRTHPDHPWGPPSLLYNGYRVFPRGKERLGCDADPLPPFSVVVKKGYSYTFYPTTLFNLVVLTCSVW